MNIADILTSATNRNPHRPCLVDSTTTLTYRNVLQAAQSTAGWLTQRGVRPGDRVGLLVPNVAAFPVLLYGALLAGAVVVPLNPLLTEHELRFCFDDAGITIAFAHDALPEGGASASAAGQTCGIPIVTIGSAGLPAAELAHAPLATSVPRADNDLAVLLYTSGTTGQPKGAELTHHNLCSNAATVATQVLRLRPNDVVMGCLPLFHVFGLTCGLNATFLGGACLALLPRFTADDALRLIHTQSVTVFQGVPTMYSALLYAPEADRYDSSSLRIAISGGAALPVEVLHAVESKFGVTILEGYGLSETSPVVSFNRSRQQRKPGSIGTPVRGVTVRILDEHGDDVPSGEVGELAVQGECVMRGYWNRPEATREVLIDGWFRTGDLARADDEGYLYIVDRKKQLIIRGGFNVYPREVEEALHEHPAVSEVAVIGITHPRLGQDIGAAVTLAPGAEITPGELREFARRRVAAYKYPRHIWFVDSLPKGPTGKILHRDVLVPPDLTGEQLSASP